MPHQYYAHSLEGKPPDEWQPLEDHLRNVAELVYCFTGSFGREEAMTHLHPFGRFH